jgi:UDP-N-acetylmuramate dehydrogenase
MSWLSEFEGRIEPDVPLSPLTWFKLGGRARHMFMPADEAQLARMVQRVRQEEVPSRVLGGGANVLIRDDGVNGLVIRLSEPAFRQVRYKDDVVTATGGADLMKLSLQCSRRGLSGLECLAGIPGTVGGAIRMNAGGRFGQISDVVRSVRLMTADGVMVTRTAEELGFGYRRSKIGPCVVVSAELQLRPDDPQQVLARFHEIWEYKKATQPLSENSAGCIFKNPQGASAGKLIDQAGLKGASQGAASVSVDHANFIITREGATASDVLKLVDRIRARVMAEFGVELELEIDVW